MMPLSVFPASADSRKRCVAGLMAVSLMLTVTGRAAAEEALQVFRWAEDFENGHPVRLVQGQGERIVHFEGTTTQHVPEGHHCYKLDVSFPGAGGGGLWSIPLAVPLEGRLTLRDRIRVEPAPAAPEPGMEAHVHVLLAGPVLGEPVFYPPRDADGSWQTFTVDLVGLTRSHGAYLAIARGLWAAERAHVGYALASVHLRVRGKNGQRVVLFLDELMVEGHVPDPAAYEAEVARRWAPVRHRIDTVVARWRAAVDKAARRLSVPPGRGGAFAQRLRAAAGSKLPTKPSRILSPSIRTRIWKKCAEGSWNTFWRCVGRSALFAGDQPPVLGGSCLPTGHWRETIQVMRNTAMDLEPMMNTVRPSNSPSPTTKRSSHGP